MTFLIGTAGGSPAKGASSKCVDADVVNTELKVFSAAAMESLLLLLLSDGMAVVLLFDKAEKGSKLESDGEFPLESDVDSVAPLVTA